MMSNMPPLPETVIWVADISPGPGDSPISCAIIRLTHRSARLMLFSQVGRTWR